MLVVYKSAMFNHVEKNVVSQKHVDIKSNPLLKPKNKIKVPQPPKVFFSMTNKLYSK